MGVPERLAGTQTLMERGVPSRRASSLMKVSRSMLGYERTDRNAELRERLEALARPGIGYRLAWAHLRQEMPGVGKNRVHRIWKEEGLSRRRRSGKKIRTGKTVPTKAEHAGHVWCMDFCFDRCEAGRTLKFLCAADEHTRECLALDVHRSITGRTVAEVLDGLVKKRGAPKYIRSDNGPEFICSALRDWAGSKGIETIFIEPGSPWQNGHAESLVSRLRPEFLDAELFGNLADAQIKCRVFQRFYNEQRPHSSLGYVPPREYAGRCTAKVDVLNSYPGGSEDSLLVGDLI
jgi:putative transposase